MRIGVTGGIGSGKTTVCHIFEQFGIPVYYADDWAKWLLNHDRGLIASIKSRFGDEAYDSTGAYDRGRMAKLVFSSPEALQALNAIVHPAVEAHALAWHREAMDSGALYTIKEAALLVESGSYQALDFLIVVTAPEEVRIQRVMTRDGVSADQVRARMRNQLPEQSKIDLANAVIINDSRQSLLRQVWAIHRQIRQLAMEKQGRQ